MKNTNHAEFNRWFILIGVFFSLILLNACSALPPEKPIGITQQTSAFQSKISIRGTIVQNDGVTPLESATVSIASDTTSQKQIAPLNTLNNCGETISNTDDRTYTQPDGSFILNLTNSDIFPAKICIQKQTSTQEITLTRRDLNTNIGTITMKPQQTTSQEKVGIVMDFYNLYDDILHKLESKSSSRQNVEIQIKSQYQDIYNIDVEQSYVTFPTFYSLFTDADKDGKADIHNYDTVYINSRSEADIALLDNKIKRTLLSYVSNGGNLFITEWNVELPDPDLDQYI